MSNLMGMMLSFSLLFPTILFGADLYLISGFKTRLETRATTLCYEISKSGGMRQEMVSGLLAEGITFTCLDQCSTISVGTSVAFELSILYTPIIMKKENMHISVTRTTIVGYL